MNPDELEPLSKQPQKKDLEIMSIEALHEYIAELEAEIARAHVAIEGKQGARESADTFFKS